MIKFAKDRMGAILTYDSDFPSASWLWEALKKDDEAMLGRVFTFERQDLLEEPGSDDEAGEFLYRFRFGRLDGDYYRIPGRIFDIPGDVLIANRGIKLERKLFIAERNVSIFRRVAEVRGSAQDIIVGGSTSSSIPFDVFDDLIKKFPNTSELNRYANARVANVIGQYFDGMKDFRADYEHYLSARKSVASPTPFNPSELFQAEVDKFVLIRDTLQRWLGSSDGRTEKESDRTRFARRNDQKSDRIHVPALRGSRHECARLS
jgi:hypothetical protein